MGLVYRANSEYRYLAVDVLIDSVIDAIKNGIPVGQHLQSMKEDSEIMLQRDPDVLIQKRLGINVPRDQASDLRNSSSPKIVDGKRKSVG